MNEVHMYIICICLLSKKDNLWYVCCQSDVLVRTERVIGAVLAYDCTVEP